MVTKITKLVLLLGSVFLVVFLWTGWRARAHTREPERPEYASERVLVKFKKGTRQLEKDEVYRLAKGKRERRLEKLGVEVVSTEKGQVEATIGQLKRHPRVEYVEPDFVAYALETPSDSYFSQQWNLAKIQATGAWDESHGGARIAILDTGIDGGHSDLVGKVVARANFTSEGDFDGNGHGTHVAGTAAALTNNNLGVAAIGYDSPLVSVKVLESDGSGYYSWVANGIIWAADNGVKVINLSLGGSSTSQAMQDAIEYAWDKGGVIVAAAGNNGSSGATYPAYYSQVVAVAATDAQDKKATFSNFGSWVDVAAPGVSVLSTVDGSYASWSGTSMATPHVAGLAALVFSDHPEWSNAQVRAKIETSADTTSGTGVYWQFGRINACRALDCTVAPAASTTPTPSPSPLPSVSPSPSPLPSPSPSASPTPSPLPSPTPLPAGDGLLGTYYDNSDFTSLVLSRVDSRVGFNWGSGSPAAGMGKDTFSVVWTGYLVPKYTQTYTLYTRTSDGVRFYLNDQLIIDRWRNQSTTEVSTSVNLVAGVKYKIRMEYYENKSSAVAQLKWRSASTSKQIIPQSQLYSQ